MTQTEAEEFIRLWQTSVKTEEIASILRISPGAVRSKVSRLRKMGIPLRKRRSATSNTRPSDIAALVRLAQELGGEQNV